MYKRYQLYVFLYLLVKYVSTSVLLTRQMAAITSELETCQAEVERRRIESEEHAEQMKVISQAYTQ